MIRRSTDDAVEFVALLREFLRAHAALTSIFTAHTPDQIPFSVLLALVSDDESAVLFRLKERSHALFRSEGISHSSVVRSEALFDLAVGSLFHEAMKLRENLYQVEVYAPRIESLREGSDENTDPLFAEFERILDKNLQRIDEVVAEVRILLAQTRDQLRRLLIERSGEKLVTRYLLSQKALVESAFPEGLDGLLAAMHGDAAQGRIEAARSLLESAFFLEAGVLLREVQGGAAAPRPQVDPLLRYAEGMQAFLDGDYTGSLSALETWVDSASHREDPDLARFASSAISQLGRLVEDHPQAAEIVAAAKVLQERLDSTDV